MIFLLSDDELDAVTGGNLRVSVRQNARGGNSVAFAGRGGDAEAEAGDGGTAIGGEGGVALSGPGGDGGANAIDAF